MGVLSDRQIRAEGIVSPCEPCEKRVGKISYGLTSYGYDARLGFLFQVFKPYPCSVIDPKAFDKRMLETVDLTRQSCWGCYGTGRLAHRGDATTQCGDCGGLGTKSPPYLTIPPHSFVLAQTMETFSVPRDTLAVVLGKSTYARCGLVVNCTPLEPEWKGTVTLELSNTTPLPLKVYPGEGVCQVVFLRSDGHQVADAETLRELRDYLYEEKFGPEQPRLVPLPFRRGDSRRGCEVSYADKAGRYMGQTTVTLPTVDGGA